MASPRGSRSRKGVGTDWSALARTAEGMRAHAYAPYSKYTVGAALIAEMADGSLREFTGANVENASYGLAICAERTAVASAVIAGARCIRAIAIATRGPRPAAPCGMCRQALAEFADDLPIALVVRGKLVRKTRLSKLLPDAFRRGSL